MTKNPILSVIIPHYNRWNELSKAIESIPENKGIQIIVVDDKSDIDVEQFDYLIEKYGHVEFYKNETDEKNAGACRNIGLQKAKGEWLAFLDSDDLFLEEFGGAFEAIKSETEADIVYFPPISVIEGTSKESNRHKSYLELANEYMDNPSEKNELRLKYRWTTPWSKFIRRSIVCDEGITFDSVTHCNDVMFSMKTAYAAKTIKVIPITFYCITVCKDSLVADNKKFKVRCLRIKINHRKYKYLKARLSANQLRMAGLGFFRMMHVYISYFFGFGVIKKKIKKMCRLEN